MLLAKSRWLPYPVLLFALAVSTSTAQEIVNSGNSIGGVVRVSDQNGNAIADQSNVVVFVDGLTNSTNHLDLLDLPKPPQISHKNRQFSPGVLPLVRGTTVDFFNDDSIFQNVFSLSTPKIFDLGIYPEGTSKFVTFQEPGLVTLYCNIHPQMTSTILVLNNNRFAITGPDGRFRIENVPDGEFTLRVWSELSEEQSREITLVGGMLHEEEFVLRQTKTVIQHRNKFGQRYREKY